MVIRYLFGCLLVGLFLPLQAYADPPYEGDVKFYVHSTSQPGTVKLHRLQLADGTRVYTTSDIEVFSLTRSSKYRARIEPMDAYVYWEQKPGTVRLYRFTQSFPNDTWKPFYTAFEPEMKTVSEHEHSKVHSMTAYVFPSTYTPQDASDIVPMYCCYNPATGEHFYTTSAVERDSYIDQAKQQLAAKQKQEAEQELALIQKQQAEQGATVERKQKEEYKQAAGSVREYKIAEVEDATVEAFSFIRKTYKVILPSDITEADLKATLISIAKAEAKKYPDLDAIAILACEREDQVPYGATIGMLEWCPEGNWGNVSPEIARTNDRSTYKYNIDIRKTVISRKKSDRPTEREFQITRRFEDVLYAEMARDIDVDHEIIERRVAKEFGISQKELHEITTRVIVYETGPFTRSTP